MQKKEMNTGFISIHGPLLDGFSALWLPLLLGFPPPFHIQATPIISKKRVKFGFTKV